MSTPVKAGLSIAAIAVAVVLFVVLQSGDDEGDGNAPAATTAEPAADAAGGKARPERDRPAEKPKKPKVPTIVVRNGEVVGGVAELEFTKGERIRFKVRSDVADHVHLHGYDVFRDVPAGGEITFDVPATLEGLFEVELEDRVIPLAEITVNPG